MVQPHYKILVENHDVFIPPAFDALLWEWSHRQNIAIVWYGKKLEWCGYPTDNGYWAVVGDVAGCTFLENWDNMSSKPMTGTAPTEISWLYINYILY